MGLSYHSGLGMSDFPKLLYYNFFFTYGFSLLSSSYSTVKTDQVENVLQMDW